MDKKDTFEDKNTLSVKKIRELLNKRSLGRTIVIWFLLLSILPMALVAWINYQQANTSLTQTAREKLALAADAQTIFLQNWFRYRFMDLANQAENRHNIQLLKELAEGLKLSNKNLKEYVISDDWKSRTDAAQNHLALLTRRFDYIYDTFLIDTSGRILHTVAHESDLGTNLLTGPLADTQFARSVRSTLETKQSLFSDLERYAPGNYQLAGFLTAPLIDKSGEMVGVFAFEIRLDELFNRIISAHRHQTKKSSAVHYLLGEDGYLRSTMHETNQEILKRIIDTEPFQHWKHTTNQNETKKLTSHKINNYRGPTGQDVFGLYQTLGIPGVNWILISEVNQDEALIHANLLESITYGLVILTALCVTLLAIYQAKRITLPISQLAKASQAAAAGDMEQRVTVSTYTEIEDLAHAFNNMLENRNKHAKDIEESNRHRGGQCT